MVPWELVYSQQGECHFGRRNVTSLSNNFGNIPLLPSGWKTAVYHRPIHKDECCIFMRDGRRRNWKENKRRHTWFFLFVSYLPRWSFTLRRWGSGEITQLVFLLGNIGGLTSCDYKVCPRSAVWSSSWAFSVARLSHLEGHVLLITLLIHSFKQQPFLNPFPSVPASGKWSSHWLKLCKAFRGVRFSKLLSCQRIDAFKLWCWRRHLRVPWTVRRSNQSILKEVNSEYSLEGQMLKLKFQYWAVWCGELTHWKRPWCWERLRAGEEGNRGWDGWIASLIQ